ncbi:MAG TPA: methyltransferase domain-containing protein [Vicinamibacteria bacterium]|nr:methyltransferase domain-containing protein [Vicinamibacteria bacterium]
MTATGEYAQRGDYHRHLDPHWSYAPIYIRKLRWVDEALEKIPKSAKILDVGAGEGALVERYRGRGGDILGVDSAYESPNVRRADLLSLPFDCGAFDTALCLDVLEHVGLLDQPRALSEIARVLKPGGGLLLSVPNLAHLHSRIRFLLSGKLTRTSAVERHPGDRPLAEYLELLRSSGFEVTRRSGIFATLPLAFRAVNRRPQKLGWLVSVADALVPFPGLRFLATIEARKRPEDRP